MQNDFPPGWDEKQVRELIAYHENRTEAEAVAEMEAAFAREDETLMSIPHGLLSVVLELIEYYEQTQHTESGEAETSDAPFAVTVPAIVKDRQIKLLSPTELAEGTKLLVTALSHEASAFGLQNGHAVFDSIWNNEEDDVYADLLKA